LMVAVFGVIIYWLIAWAMAKPSPQARIAYCQNHNLSYIAYI